MRQLGVRRSCLNLQSYTNPCPLFSSLYKTCSTLTSRHGSSSTPLSLFLDTPLIIFILLKRITFFLDNALVGEFLCLLYSRSFTRPHLKFIDGTSSTRGTDSVLRQAFRDGATMQDSGTRQLARIQ